MDFTVKAYTKKELRILFNISACTLTKWLNIVYYEDIKKIGYEKRSKILTANIVNCLFEKVGVLK